VPIPSALPFFNIRWDDIPVHDVRRIMIGSGLLVVTMRTSSAAAWPDRLLRALAGLYVVVGAPLVAGAQSSCTSARSSVFVLFAIMLTQSKSVRQARLSDQAVPAAIARSCWPSCSP